MQLLLACHNAAARMSVLTSPWQQHLQLRVISVLIVYIYRYNIYIYIYIYKVAILPGEMVAIMISMSKIILH